MRLDYLRRVDLASAALDAIQPVWHALDAKRAAHKLKAKHTRQNSRICGVAFAVGLGLHWWLSRDGHAGFGVGAWVMIGSAVLWILQLWDLARTQAGISGLETRESDYLYAAKSAGANFDDYRRLMQAKAKVEAETEDTIELDEADSWLGNAWLSVKWELLDTVNGSSTFDWWQPRLSAAPSKDLDGKK